jgi:hypothetical protein
MSDGPVPPVNAPPPPNRFLMGYTVGTGAKILGGIGISSMASSPNEGDLSTTPFKISNLGTDQASKSVTVPVVQGGNQYVLTTTIPLPLLPGYTSNQPPNGPGSTPKGPSVTRPQDQLIFRASMTIQNPIVGLSIVRFTALPQARSGSQVFNGPILPSGQQYSSFQVFCTVVFEATVGPSSSAGAVTISTEGTLTRQAGGAAT